jgi:hypothetical protein
MPAPLHQEGNWDLRWIRTVIEDEAIRTDVDRTVALWIRAGLSANEAWFELTRERRRYASWEAVRGWMMRWARRDHRLESAQLLLPGLDRRAA